MIPLTLGARSESNRPFVARVRYDRRTADSDYDAVRIAEGCGELGFAGPDGVFVVETAGCEIDGDVLLIDPARGAAERILRAGSLHNTLLVTERCDQLCVMCSQPPKKTHVDRFGYFREACVLAEPDAVIGISGGEPTLYKEDLLRLVECVLEERPDLSFHILSNGQHFEESDIERLRNPAYRKVIWGVPLYSAKAEIHDRIVGKAGAFERLDQSFFPLLMSGARIELRTVVMQDTVPGLYDVARLIGSRLSFIESWSVMQLENIGFARNRWSQLYFDHSENFTPVATAIDRAQRNGTEVRLFNFPLCTVPSNYRHLAPVSISDWKRKYADACEGCSKRSACAGFFEWHPQDALMAKVTPL